MSNGNELARSERRGNELVITIQSVCGVDNTVERWVYFMSGEKKKGGEERQVV